MHIEKWPLSYTYESLYYPGRLGVGFAQFA